MLDYFKKVADFLLDRKGQVLLLFLLLAAAAALRFTLFVSNDIDLDNMGYVAEVSQTRGKVISSCSSSGRFILDRSKLLWIKGDEQKLVADDVVNILSFQDRIWVKTRDHIALVKKDSGMSFVLLSNDNLRGMGIPFPDARLVGIGEDRFFLNFGSSVIGVEKQGIVEGPYHMDGRLQPLLVEANWRDWAVSIRDNSWVVYSNFRPVKQVSVNWERGLLRDAYLSPDGSHVIYVLQQEDHYQVWYGSKDGSRAELLHQEEDLFSSFYALWSPDSRMVVITVLGYADDETDYSYSSSTLIYKAWEGGTVLSNSQGREVKALIPTAWDCREHIIWFYWLHEEDPYPIYYRLFER